MEGRKGEKKGKSWVQSLEPVYFSTVSSTSKNLKAVDYFLTTSD